MTSEEGLGIVGVRIQWSWRAMELIPSPQLSTAQRSAARMFGGITGHHPDRHLWSVQAKVEGR